jgi:hypothetical protein
VLEDLDRILAALEAAFWWGLGGQEDTDDERLARAPGHLAEFRSAFPADWADRLRASLPLPTDGRRPEEAARGPEECRSATEQLLWGVVTLLGKLDARRARIEQAPQAGRPASLLRLADDLAGWVERLTPRGVQAAARVEVVRAAAPAKAKPPRKTLDRLNAKAMRLARVDHSFVDGSARQWANRIGCSPAEVVKLPLWKHLMEMTGRGRKGKGPTPKKAVGLSSVLESALVAEDDELERLTRESEAENRRDPSPLVDDPPEAPRRRVYGRRRL